MDVVLRKPMTREQFFHWAEVQDGRYEFDGEQPIAMTGGTNSYSLIVINIIVELRNRLRGRSCRALSAEGGGGATVGNAIRYPDATATCSPVPGSERLIPEPVVVFEVISETSARVDRFIKMREYHAVPSIRRYVLVEQHVPVIVSCSRRNDESWMATSPSTGDTLSLPELGIEIPVVDIFDGVDFAEDEGPATAHETVGPTRVPWLRHGCRGT